MYTHICTSPDTKYDELQPINDWSYNESISIFFLTFSIPKITVMCLITFQLVRVIEQRKVLNNKDGDSRSMLRSPY